MLRGMANISYWAHDIKAARNWYNQVFGTEPYFQRPNAENPMYIEYRVGDYQHEAGIADKKFMPANAAQNPGGTILYWHVDDVQKTFDHLISLGAVVYEPIIDRSGGKGTFVTASVTDPFGNVLGIMYNQHYLDILEQKSK